MTDLIERLEGVEVGHADLSFEVWKSLNPDKDWRWMDRCHETIVLRKYEDGSPGNPVVSLDPVTTDLSAIREVVKTQNPDLCMSLEDGPEMCVAKLGYAKLVSKNSTKLIVDYKYAGYHSQLEIALCIALLKSQSEEG